MTCHIAQVIRTIWLTTMTSSIRTRKEPALVRHDTLNGVHKQAANDHEAAAKQHQQAAQSHDQNKLPEARDNAKSAMDCCNPAKKSTDTACAATTK